MEKNEYRTPVNSNPGSDYEIDTRKHCIAQGLELMDASIITDKVIDFIDITKQMAKTYTIKNHDYGDSFSESLKKIGPAYATGRLLDKLNRIINLTKPDVNQQVKDESIKDTLLDLACYSIMFYMEYSSTGGDNE